MNSPSEARAELLDLCDQLLDGTLSTAQRARLEHLVLGDPALRRLYVEYLHLHAGLRQSRPADAPLAGVLRFAPEEAPRGGRYQWRRWQQAVLAVAAALLLLIGGVWFGQHHRGAALDVPAIATLAETKGARWESGRLPTEAGAALGPGRLRLAEGLATIVFQSGATVTLEAPAELELLTANRCFLHSGALVAHVPPPAVGFVVETAHARLVDHGTDFGVTADASGQAQVQVFQGEVELHHHRSGEHLRLSSRRSALVTTGTLAARAGDDPETTRWLARRAPAVDPGTLVLSTAAGRGQAAYVASPGTVTHHSDTLLLLKNTTTTAYRRKACLRFDLEPLAGRRVAEATLSLVFEPTGFGFASFLGDAQFAVYAVVDDGQDDWDPARLEWDTMPAARNDGGAVDDRRAVKVGTFVLPAGTLGGPVTVRSPRLTERLNADGNRLLTLIVVRETLETGRGASLVHGFAGNHHPTLAPPSLWVKLETAAPAPVR
jgi:hypothetical protein